MFKKSLLAAAIVASASAGAADVTITGETVGIQGNVGAVATIATTVLPNVTTKAIEVQLGAEYAVGDIATFTLSGALLHATTTPNLTFVDGGGDDDTMTFGLLGTDLVAGTVSYRVTAIVAGTDTVFTSADGYLTLDGLVLASASLPTTAGATVDLAYSATAGAFDLDKPYTNDTLFTMVDEFSDVDQAAGLVELSKIISVDKDRFSFTVGDSDSLAITTVQNSVDNNGSGNPVSVTHTLTAATAGGFSFLVDALASAENNALAINDSNGDPILLNNAAVTVTADTVTFIDNSAAFGIGTSTFAFDMTNNTAGIINNSVLEVSSFSVDSVVAYTDGAAAAQTEVVASALNGGAWTLDSSQVFIPYVPFGDNTQVILDVSNTGATDAAVNVRCLGTDTTSWVDLGSIGTANLMSTTKLGDSLGTKLQASACVKTGATNGRVSLEITSEAKTSAITVYSGFKVLSEDDRGFTGIYGALASSNQ